ncbi:hypothetical protein SAMN05216354_0902 [Xylanibacter ruminicola]|uniref:Uncharacterized protein n=1 Tax=Xylanibacter ruminicola TaxID=839 RepID=A0A1H5T6W8_XYLRU|nr:hypothetical protein SAMN05216354_0902 [Xylanibacter ruminicola]
MCYFAPDFGENAVKFQDSKFIINILKYYNYVRN